MSEMVANEVLDDVEEYGTSYRRFGLIMALKCHRHAFYGVAIEISMSAAGNGQILAA